MAEINHECAFELGQKVKTMLLNVPVVGEIQYRIIQERLLKDNGVGVMVRYGIWHKSIKDFTEVSEELLLDYQEKVVV